MCIYIKYIAYKTVGYNYTFYFCFDFYFFCKFQSSFIALGAKLYDFSPRLTCSPLLSLSHSSVATQSLLWPGHSYEALCWGFMGWYIRSKVWWLYWCYKKSGILAHLQGFASECERLVRECGRQRRWEERLTETPVHLALALLFYYYFLPLWSYTWAKHTAGYELWNLQFLHRFFKKI